ncbi:hypothetical protein LOTGIDRAFT_162003 [Lottia gigantea]|uniref:Paraneoplastic antigen Ma-like C-terminal domain-containing protein n=1 Tax=Lottia gigantea TaxID=225164 RepID=V4AHV4_LOTGI|nr:hypothetical protein LOTGIDRAFT_162003 [Lottia gigantea]ESO92976.1 hypothetical protein LOTGIDRAFT_162003 [Lottia gigantea]
MEKGFKFPTHGSNEEGRVEINTQSEVPSRNADLADFDSGRERSGTEYKGLFTGFDSDEETLCQRNIGLPVGSYVPLTPRFKPGRFSHTSAPRTYTDTGFGNTQPNMSSLHRTVHRQIARKEKEPDKFDCQHTEWSEFIMQFERVANWNMWDPYEKAQQLIMCLSGPALKLLSTLSSSQLDSYEEVKLALTNRFNPGERLAAHQIEFRNRRRRGSESLSHFGYDLQRLAFKAFPHSYPESLEYHIVDQYIYGLGHIKPNCPQLKVPHRDERKDVLDASSVMQIKGKQNDDVEVVLSEVKIGSQFSNEQGNMCNVIEGEDYNDEKDDDNDEKDDDEDDHVDEKDKLDQTCNEEDKEEDDNDHDYNHGDKYEEEGDDDDHDEKDKNDDHGDDEDRDKYGEGNHQDNEDQGKTVKKEETCMQSVT